MAFTQNLILTHRTRRRHRPSSAHGPVTEDYDQTLVDGNPSGSLTVAGAIAAGPRDRHRRVGRVATFQGTVAGARPLPRHATGPWSIRAERSAAAPANEQNAGARNRRQEEGRGRRHPDDVRRRREPLIPRRRAMPSRPWPRAPRRGAARELRFHGTAPMPTSLSPSPSGRPGPIDPGLLSKAAPARPVDRRRHDPDAHRRRRRPRVAAACLLDDDQGHGRARRQDPPVRRRHPGPATKALSRVGFVTPGTTPVCVSTPVGRLGLAVCYDLELPQSSCRIMSRGAEWFVVPSAFTAPTGRAHWEDLCCGWARAIENPPAWRRPVRLPRERLRRTGDS